MHFRVHSVAPQGQHGEGAKGGGGLGSVDPFSDLMAREAGRAAKRALSGDDDRARAHEFVARVLRMCLGNLDQ